MAGSNMQKAEFCISPGTVKCYFSRSNFAPCHLQSHACFEQRYSPPLNRSSAKQFLNQRTKK
jgi:hypothetical protein